MSSVVTQVETQCLSLGDEGCEILNIVQTILPIHFHPMFVRNWRRLASNLCTRGDVLTRIPSNERHFDPVEVLEVLLEDWLMKETREKATIERLIQILIKTGFNDSAHALETKYFSKSKNASPNVSQNAQNEPQNVSKNASQNVSQNTSQNECHVLIQDPSSNSRTAKFVQRSTCQKGTCRTKYILKIISPTLVVILVALLVCSIIYSSKASKANSSNKFSPGNEVEIEASDLQHLEEHFLKSKDNVTIKLIIRANSSRMTDAPKLKYAHIIRDIVVHGETFSAGLTSLLAQTKYLRSISIQLPHPHWNLIFPASEKFTELQSIAISTPKQHKNVPCPLISLGDSFCENFGSIQTLNITYGCISFESRYQVFDCKTLKQLSIQILYTRNQYLDLGLVNRLHRIEEVDLYLYFDTECPMGDETIRLGQEISRFVNEGSLRCINIWSNCSLNSDFDVFSRQICSQR